MPTNITETLIQDIDDLVKRAESLGHQASKSPTLLGHDSIEHLSFLAARTGQLIHRLYGKDSQFSRSLNKVLEAANFTAIYNRNYGHVSELAGILKGIQHEVKAGLLSEIRQLMRAEIFADFLEMAEHLLDEGYKDPAAVLLGSVLEDSLRKLASRFSVDTTNANGKALTINPLNEALMKAGAYSALVQKQIVSWADLRNKAAHGQYGEYDATQVRQMLLFVQKFCGDYLS